MNIPLDNLYHWIRGLANEPVSIYTFKPHGSKNIKDLSLLEVDDTNIIAPEIVCHDQEPLNYSQHADVSIFDLWLHVRQSCNYMSRYDAIMSSLESEYRYLNFYTMLRALKPQSIFDRYILLHSEKNSIDVEKFSIVAEPVYYWCHGILARDWYRFAEHDVRLNKKLPPSKTFLVYCRAWSGTREYRLKFLELLLDNNLITDCKTSILHSDQGHRLESYQCADKKMQPTDAVKMLNIINNHFSADSSADYIPEDFIETNISIVLETIANSEKIHLTEKTLRPIACGHPFMLMAGPGALEYLRSYGFKTFSPWINESYDLETDPIKRMQLIVAEMKRIQCLPEKEKTQLFNKIKKIALHNKSHFFSSSFANTIVCELTSNLNQAISKIKLTKGRYYLNLLRANKKYLAKINPSVANFKILKTLRKLRSDPTTSLSAIINQFPPGFFNQS